MEILTPKQAIRLRELHRAEHGKDAYFDLLAMQAIEACERETAFFQNACQKPE